MRSVQKLHDPGFATADDYKRARDLLEAANYTERGFGEALNIDKKAPPNTGDPVLLRRTRGGSPLDTLLRLFLICVPVEEEAARRALAPMELSQWVEAGLLRVDGGMATSVFRISRVRDLILAHDFRVPQGDHRADFVMGVGGATRTQAMSAVTRPCKRVLDVGTGSGILAFLASRHSEQVFAVDRNPRSIAVAKFNAALNGLTNVECVEGSLFEPYENMRFDLIISDPPFVVSPPSGFLYLHGGMRGDEFCRSLARGAAQHLEEGGYFQMLCNWPHHTGRDASAEFAKWFDGTGCDTWVLRIHTEDAASYATTWVDHIHGSDRGKSAPLFNQWMDYYESEGIEALSLGLVTMRRRTDRPNWFDIDDAPPAVKEDCGTDIEERFHRRDFLIRHNDVQLLDAVLRCSPEARLDYQCEPSGNEWRMAESSLRLERALAFSAKADPFTAGLLIRCDGKTPLRALVPDFARALDASVEAVTPACVSAVRKLLELGFLQPAETPADGILA